jgi:hypothetical protein
MNRGIASLALALAICFLFLTNYDPQFFLFHFYESIIYLVIVLMLFYFEDRWAYMLGILAPAAWLLLEFAIGGLGEFMRQVSLLFVGKAPSYAASFLGAVISILSVAMIAYCAYWWKREFSGLKKGLSTFLVSLVIVVVYYGLLVLWFWRTLGPTEAS